MYPPSHASAAYVLPQCCATPNRTPREERTPCGRCACNAQLFPAAQSLPVPIPQVDTHVELVRDGSGRETSDAEDTGGLGEERRRGHLVDDLGGLLVRRGLWGLAKVSI